MFSSKAASETMELKVKKLPMLKKVFNAGEKFTGDRVYAEPAAGEDPENVGNYDVCRQWRSFQMVEMDGVPFSDTAEERLVWLRSQIIGGDVEFDSPFGERRLCYADHTASARSLRYIEDFILQNVLPFYGYFSISIIYHLNYIFQLRSSYVNYDIHIILFNDELQTYRYIY